MRLATDLEHTRRLGMHKDTNRMEYLDDVRPRRGSQQGNWDTESSERNLEARSEGDRVRIPAVER
jgi:hypothetical protein